MAISEVTKKNLTSNKPVVAISYDDILSAVKTWTREQQVMLLSDVHHIVQSESNVEPADEVTLESFWRLLPDDLHSLTDEELDEMKIQWRIEKHSR